MISYTAFSSGPRRLVSTAAARGLPNLSSLSFSKLKPLKRTLATLPKFRYATAWFCPYAHRATLALEHHKERVEYEWVESLGWYQQEDKNNVTGTGKEWFYHWKSDELKRVNPSALVPTLIPLQPETNDDKETTWTPLEDKAVFESIVTVEYVDLVAAPPDHLRLLPIHDPYLTAQCRIWADRVNRECCSPYYGVLVRKEESERQEHFELLLQGLRQFSQQLQKTSGPTFLPDGQLSTVDMTLIPWAWRYYVFEHYRGPEYAIPKDDSELAPYHAWYDHVMNVDSVRRTLPDKDRYLEHIQKYADGSARSKVANAVRRGVAAHELDDEKDDY